MTIHIRFRIYGAVQIEPGDGYIEISADLPPREAQEFFDAVQRPIPITPIEEEDR